MIGSIGSNKLDSSEWRPKEMHEITLGFIGTGQMAQALAHGIVQSMILPAPSIWLSNPSLTEETICRFESKGYKTTTDNSSLCRLCDIIILAVKPYHIPKVCEDLVKCFQGNVLSPEGLFHKHKPIFISVCAGVKTSTIQSRLDMRRYGGASCVVKCCRAMPNTPCLIGSGAVAVCFGPDVTKEEAANVKRLFEAVGTVFEVKEDQMDAVTGLSGSGPAFVYMMIEALSDAGVRGGLPRETALGLAAQTVYGSASMVLETKLHPAILKEQVTSPGGTTIEGVAALERHGFRNAVMSAVDAAKSQATNLSK